MVRILGSNLGSIIAYIRLALLLLHIIYNVSYIVYIVLIAAYRLIITFLLLLLFLVPIRSSRTLLRL